MRVHDGPAQLASKCKPSIPNIMILGHMVPKLEDTKKFSTKAHVEVLTPCRAKLFFPIS